MTPTALKTFLAVQKHRSFTVAAAELFVSQPAVSRRIRQLEEEVGVRLFEQLGKALHLTRAGEALAEEAEMLLGDHDRALETIRRHAASDGGRLRIGASGTPGGSLLPPVLGEFHRAYPQVELTYTVENSRSIEQGIIRNELDLGLIGEPPASPALVARPVVGDEIVCCVGPHHPLAGGARVVSSVLHEEICVTRERGSATRKLTEAWLTDTGCRFRRFIELTSSDAIKRLVGAGVGISFMSVHTLGDELQDGRLCRVPVRGLHLQRSIHLVQHADKHRSPAMAAFEALMKETLG